MSWIAVLAIAAAPGDLLEGIAVPQGPATIAVQMVEDGVGIGHLSWDTEGSGRETLNLLYAPVQPVFLVDGDALPASEATVESVEADGRHTVYRFDFESGSIWWRIGVSEDSLTLGFGADGAAPVEAIRLWFPFTPKAAATAVIPSAWEEGADMRLPAIVNAPDLGPMLLTASPSAQPRVWLEGTRSEDNRVDLYIEWRPRGPEPVVFRLAPVHMPAPAGFADDAAWRAIRRGWFNMLQPSAQWGTPGRPQYAPPGLLANNVVSDPVSCVLHMMADHIALAPQLSPEVNAAPSLRKTVDWWLDHGIEPNGEMRSWRQNKGMLDANTGPLIGAWAYVEATGDRDWLAGRIGTLERLADYLAERDIDGDGLVEAVHSGNYGTQIGRFGSSAYDTINSGHKDGYGNALTYRTWRCLADLETRLGRMAEAARYRELAAKLKAAYVDALYNPETGWLGWWRSEDGELHDLATPMITSIAILYGLVEPDRGRPMLNALWAKLEETGFDRFEIGVPLTFEPVRKGDYMQPRPESKSRPHGSPELEDGSDTFQMYLNGGCCVSDAYYFITALHMTGEAEKAARILRAMVKRQVEGMFENGGGFQNGVVDRYPAGAEFYDWDGNTCGYEGHLVYSFSFLQAVLLRDDALRARLFRPLLD